MVHKQKSLDEIYNSRLSFSYMKKTILITGATSGIGKSTALEIASQGYNLILACRNAGKMDSFIKSFTLQKDQFIRGVILDLSSLQSIKDCAEQLHKDYNRIDVLVNNAGLFNLQYKESTDGYEETFAVNHLGSFFFTKLLIPLMEKTGNSRIVNVGSNSHYFASLKMEDLFFRNRKYSGFKAYGASRLATVLFTQELSDRFNEKGITANCGHPGHVATNIWNFDNPGFLDRIARKIQESTAITPDEGAQTIIYLAISDEVEGITGKYYADMKIKKPSRKCRNLQLQKELWAVSEKLSNK